MNEESLFVELLNKQSLTQQEAFLQAQCGADVALRKRLEKLLACHVREDGILDAPLNTAEQKPINQIGCFRLKELLGEGGFGQVFAAEQQEPVRREVAIKLIKPGMDSREVIARFNAERQTLALMDHPNIAKVLEAGTAENQRPYFIMEIVRGKSVTEFCDLERFTTRDRLNLFIPICQAVQHAHQKGVIHRDLKPGNILVTEQDGHPTVKVIDFGVAKALDPHQNYGSPQTRESQLIGTPEYMSPEQAELGVRDIDTRTDIYSLGVLLYELLAGATPFDGERWKSASFDEIRRIIREEEPPRPSDRFSTLGGAATTISAKRRSHPRELSRLFRGELDWIVMKAIEKDRDRRYPTVTEFAKDIRRYLADEPVEASPPSTLYRLKKFTHKHRFSVWSGIAMLLLLTSGIVGTTLGMIQARNAQAQEKRRAIAEERERIRAVHAESKAQAKVKEAQEAANAANKLIAFLRDDVLGMASMSKQEEQGLSPRPHFTVREALDQAAKKLAKQFDFEPFVEANIRLALGQSYLQLGEHQKAVQQLETAAEIALKRTGANAQFTHETQVHLARAYRALNKVTEAIGLHEKLREIQMAELGPEHERTLFNLHHLAECYAKAGRHPEALALQKQVLSVYVRQLGPEHENTLATQQSLGVMHSSVGNVIEAQKVLEGLEQVMPRVLGDEHMRTMGLRQQLGVLYWKQKQFDRAAKAFELLLPAVRKIYGETHLETYRLMANLGINYREAGRLSEASKLLTATHEATRSISSMRSWTGMELARTHLAAKDHEKAAQVMSTLIEACRRFHPSHSKALAEELLGYGEVLNQLKDLSRAEALLRECLEIWQETKSDPAVILVTKSALGSTLLNQAFKMEDSAAAPRLQEAEQLLIESANGLTALEQHTPGTRAWLAKTIDSLMTYYKFTGNLDQLDAWRLKKMQRSD